MAYSANGYEFSDKELSRVKYDLEYDSDNDLYRFKEKPSEVIKVANTAATDIFFDTSNDNDQVWFDSSALDYSYNDQIFIDKLNNKNFIVLSSTITGDCLSKMNSLINDESYFNYWVIQDGLWTDSGIWDDSEIWEG